MQSFVAPPPQSLSQQTPSRQKVPAPHSESMVHELPGSGLQSPTASQITGETQPPAGSSMLMIGEQVPVEHSRQMPPQPLLQHTPSTQLLLEHWWSPEGSIGSAAQATPLDLSGWQVPPEVSSQ